MGVALGRQDYFLESYKHKESISRPKKHRKRYLKSQRSKIYTRPATPKLRIF